jgi:hypothetical protein
VGPGETHVFDLGSMTTWQGKAEAIEYRISGAPASFVVTLQGAQLTVRGNDNAAPGTVESVSVEVTSHPGVTPARITLRVGAAPSTLPQGGQAAQQCSQASGSSCTIDVIGAPGEVNPLPSTPLQLVSVTASSACAGVTFAVASASRVVASWDGDAPGATCSARFTVRDAQGRQTAAGRDGSVVLDLLGFPRARVDRADGLCRRQPDAACRSGRGADLVPVGHGFRRPRGWPERRDVFGAGRLPGDLRSQR